jgi:hypothetical protein
LTFLSAKYIKKIHNRVTMKRENLSSDFFCCGGGRALFRNENDGGMGE